MNVQVAYLSEKGRRSNNEDMYGIPAPLVKRPLDPRGFAINTAYEHYHTKGLLFMVADGVGGQEGGEVASAIAVKDVAHRYYEDPSANLSLSLLRVIEAANVSIRQKQKEGGLKQMATTLTSVVIHPDSLIVANVGDSRAYLIRDGEVQQLTVDHSLAEETQSNQPKYQHCITRSLGNQARVAVDLWELPIQANDRILLCSDGLSGFVSEQTIGKLAQHTNLQKGVNGLITTAYEQGSSDNISSILIHIQGI